MITRRAALTGLAGVAATAAWAGLTSYNHGEQHNPFDNIGDIGDRSTPARSMSLRPFAPVSQWALKLINAAESQVGVTTVYDGAYVGLKYPGGDVDVKTGVCTDVVVRAYRSAFNIDLQRLVHEDMRRAFSAYPPLWGLKRPDSNIDHRRVPNLERFFTSNNAHLPITQNAREYLPGDLVSQRLPGNLPHIAIVSHHASRDGLRPMIIHNIGRGTQIEDRLFDFNITGHFRFFPDLT